jgi:hypothetical protein
MEDIATLPASFQGGQRLHVQMAIQGMMANLRHHPNW